MVPVNFLNRADSTTIFSRIRFLTASTIPSFALRQTASTPANTRYGIRDRGLRARDRGIGGSYRAISFRCRPMDSGKISLLLVRRRWSVAIGRLFLLQRIRVLLASETLLKLPIESLTCTPFPSYRRPYNAAFGQRKLPERQEQYWRWALAIEQCWILSNEAFLRSVGGYLRIMYHHEMPKTARFTSFPNSY